MNKALLRDHILGALRAELDRQRQAALLARDEAISEESRAENKYDTHSQEAAYLAEGQAKLAAGIGEAIKLYETLPLPDFAPGAPAAIGALVEVAGRGGDRWYFLGPRSGGLELEIDGAPVLVLTPQSPLGRHLLGRRAGDRLPEPGGAGGAMRIVAVL